MWVVHELNNIDKHRLVPVVALHPHTGKSWISRDQGQTYAPLVCTEQSRDRLEHGTEIARVPIGDNPHVQVNVPLGADIAFEKVGGVELLPVCVLLRDATADVWDLVNSFRGEFPRE